MLLELLVLPKLLKLLCFFGSSYLSLQLQVLLEFLRLPVFLELLRLLLLEFLHLLVILESTGVGKSSISQ